MHGSERHATLALRAVAGLPELTPLSFSLSPLALPMERNERRIVRMTAAGIRCLVFVGVLFAIHAGTHTAIAQSQELRRWPEYREQIRKALHEYDLGNWHEAKLYFSDAHAIYPNARTLRGLGLTAYALRNYVEAVGFLGQALVNEVQPLSGDLRPNVSELLGLARRFVANVRLDLEPNTAMVRVDERMAQRDLDGSIWLDPGPHELVASAPGFESVSRRLNLDAGGQADLTLRLPASVPVTSPAMAPPPSAAEARAAASGSTSRFTATTPRDSSSVASFIVVGVSGAIAVTGGVLLGVTASDIAAVEDAHRGTEWSSVRSAYDRSPGLSTAGFLMVGAGVAGVALGLTWALWPSEQTELSMRVAPDAVSFRARY